MKTEVRTHNFLRGLNNNQLQKLADASMYVQFEPGEVIFREGEPANRFYLIHSGEVEIEAPPGDGLVSIQKLHAGDVLGWSWLFEPYRWHFNARAKQRTTATFYYGTRLREQGDDDPVFGYELMKRISRVLLDRLQCTRQQSIKSEQMRPR